MVLIKISFSLLTIAAFASAKWYPNFLIQNWFWYFESCDYDNDVLTKLQIHLNNQLFGQHIVIENLVNALSAHSNSKVESRKPLVISLQGSPGTGKNYVSDIIAKALFEKGLQSKFVKKYLGRSAFPRENEVEYYREKINQDVEETICRCEKSLFIFDEVDKMPTGIFNGLTPLLNFNQFVNKCDITKSIFLFLSNSGGTNITRYLGNHLKYGQREEVKLEDFENDLRKFAFNDVGGFKGTSLIDASVIDHFLPFLPLEKQHIEECIKVEFRKWKLYDVPKAAIESIINDVVIFDGEFNRFATAGCKGLEKKVALRKNKLHTRKVEL